MTARTICVVTGTRAEFGLLSGLMRAIADDPELTLQVIATGMHLSPEFGLTYRAIEEAGFTIDEKVEMLLSSDSPVGIATSIGVGTIGFALALRRLSPDLIVVLGDRFEVLAAVQAALVACIPVAHVHGGELSEGAIDDSIRHALTKMAHLHFTATEEYRRRVIQLGESPDRVHAVGAPGLDAIGRVPLLTREQLEQTLGVTLASPSFLVTYHPETLRPDASAAAMGELLAALDEFSGATIVFTKPNADTGGRVIGQAIDAYVRRHPGRAVAHTSLGQQRYLSALRHVDLVIGNSSSGLIEAPSFRIPTVNVGDRQRGRIRAASVIDCAPQRGAITDAIRQALSPAFRRVVEGASNPYGDGEATGRIVAILKRTDLAGLVVKRFHDLPQP